ncbi:MAG: hypothetical protein FE78DRAFT_363314 [Acidomyces sp. 'richmondensis']|nr:MAG: hypothetical protein FE78DRAFT_363314 [Acidomyces sp. 'richmondensis']
MFNIRFYSHPNASHLVSRPRRSGWHPCSPSACQSSSLPSTSRPLGCCPLCCHPRAAISLDPGFVPVRLPAAASTAFVAGSPDVDVWSFAATSSPRDFSLSPPPKPRYPLTVSTRPPPVVCCCDTPSSPDPTGLATCAALLTPPLPAEIPPRASSLPGLVESGCAPSALAVSVVDRLPSFSLISFGPLILTLGPSAESVMLFAYV